ncbi:leucyl aminopeptidase [candidate division KSB1 bacterium]|nr:MAG: leucyl aminopeptidase [candidate division KSB1 bacterium]
MKVSVKSGNILKERSDILIFPIFENERKLNEDIKKIDTILQGEISYAIKSKDFTGELNKTLMLYTKGKIPSKKVMLLGIGKKKDIKLERLREAFGTAAIKLKDLNVKKVTIYNIYEKSKQLFPDDSSKAMVEGILLALFNFDRLKTDKKDKKTKIKEIKVFEKKRRNLFSVRKAADSGKIFAEAANYVRCLQAEPSNIATPEFLEKEAKNIADENGLKFTSFNESDLKNLNMNLFLSVAKGSKEPPRLIILEYHTESKNPDSIALVGKGITFDSGGISIKPSKDMDKMKYDMSGGAAVLGVMKFIREINPGLNVIGAVPATENLPGGSATKPGDIVKSYSGKTVEIVNTDAEGRLILADTLSYIVRNYEPGAIVDLATLTGACVVALGHCASGIMGNNRKLIEKIKRAGEITGERVWELPLWEEYSKQLESEFADLKNIGSSGGGAITAGAFLKEFVEKTPWVHIDIAGTAYDVEKKSYLQKGPTGVGARLILELLMNWE